MSTKNSLSDRLTLICPNLSCRRTLNVPSSTRGKVMRCAYCNAPFRVPDRSESGSEVVSNPGSGEKS